MAYVLAQTGLDAVLDNRPATAIGLLGVVGCGLLGLVLAQAGAGVAVDEALDELAFTPGGLLALGSPDVDGRHDDPGVAPPSPPVEPAAQDLPTPTEPTEDPPASDATVTDEDSPPQPVRPTRPPRPQPSGPSSGPAGPSLPTLPGPPGNPSQGDPFGDPNGLDDLTGAGDPWAGGVIAAIEAMDVGTVYAKPIAGNVRFQLTICKDGTVSKVAYKGGSATQDERDLVLLELGRLRIPRPPAAIASHMKGSCAKIGHTFSWTVDGTR